MKYKLLAAGVHRAIQVTDELLVTTRKFVEIADADLGKAQNDADSLGYKLVSEEEANAPSADSSAEASGATTATPNPSAASKTPTPASGAPEGGK